jgi:hypothetical protein
MPRSFIFNSANPSSTDHRGSEAQTRASFMSLDRLSSSEAFVIQRSNTSGVGGWVYGSSWLIGSQHHLLPARSVQRGRRMSEKRKWDLTSTHSLVSFHVIDVNAHSRTGSISSRAALRFSRRAASSPRASWACSG